MIHVTNPSKDLLAALRAAGYTVPEPDKPVKVKIAVKALPKIARTTFTWPTIAAKSPAKTTANALQRTTTAMARKPKTRKVKIVKPTRTTPSSVGWRNYVALTEVATLGGLCLAGWPIAAGLGLLGLAYCHSPTPKTKRRHR